MNALKKFYSFVKLNWKTSIVYRFSFMASIIISPLYLLMAYFIWQAVFTTSSVIKGYTFDDMITYYVVGMLVNHFIFNMVGNNLQDKILSGDLSQDLLKPFPVFLQLLSSDVSERAFAFVVEVIPVFIISLFLFKLKVNLLFGSLFLVSMILSFFINFLIGYLMGMLAFWTSRIESVQWLMFLVVRFLSGEFIPLDFFGPLMFGILELLPFYYLRYGVIQVFLGKLGIIGSLRIIGIQIVWIFLLYLAVQTIWKIAIKRYGAVGG
ncbi:MAG: ABC-2 family transporter protein [archaeon]